MATIPLTYDVASVPYDYPTGVFDAEALSTDPASMTPTATSAATITPA